MSGKSASTTDLELWLCTVLHWFWKHLTIEGIKIKYLVSSFIELVKIHFIYFKKGVHFLKKLQKVLFSVWNPCLVMKQPMTFASRRVISPIMDTHLCNYLVDYLSNIWLGLRKFQFLVYYSLNCKIQMIEYGKEKWFWILSHFYRFLSIKSGFLSVYRDKSKVR